MGFLGTLALIVFGNSQLVIEKFNTSSKAKSMDSYDFSTLYTSIPHDSLKHNLGLLIDEAYRVRGALWLTVNKSGKCMWSRTKSGSINIDARLLMIREIIFISALLIFHLCTVTYQLDQRTIPTSENWTNL